MSIVLAEGNPTHCRFARQLLDQHFPDYGPVLEVADGATALQRALTARPELLARTIREAADGALELEELGRRGRAYVEREADRVVAMERYRALVRELLAA